MKFDLTPSQIEAFRKEHTVSMEPPLPAWAEEENRVLNAICDIAAAATVTMSKAGLTSSRPWK